jgi:hypothetical protein
MRRIAIHGGMTALVLGIVGLMFAEMASMWIAASRPSRAVAKESPPDTSAMRLRLPLIMAISGFVFVAASEMALHHLRKRRPQVAPTPPPIDQTEQLLNELIAKEEAKAAASQATMALPPASSDNTPTPSSPPPGHPTGGGT